MFNVVREKITKLSFVVSLLLALAFLVFNTSSYAQQCQAFDRPESQATLALESVLSPAVTVDRPTSMVQQPNNSSRWFVIDQNGTVSLFSGGQTFNRLGTMLDIRDRVTRMFNGRDNWNEMGLLSIAAHPDFATNGYVYLYYSATGPNATVPLYARFSRFTSFDNGLTLDPNSETVIFQLDRNRQFHWGGQMMFNPNDGYFNMSIGDGGVRSRSQNRFNLNGSFIRLDMGNGQLPYSIPPDNPYANGGGLPEIYAKGLRNPWRWSIDAVTNRIFLGDVGKADWEEINIIESGENYGWPIRQGARCYEPTNCSAAGLTDPIIEYPHDDTGGVAVIGGYVYRGTNMPNFVGHYIYSDSLGRIWSIDTTDVDNAVPQVILEDVPQKFSFAQGADNELYLLNRGGIDRLVEAPGAAGINPVPELLSETGCFASLNPLEALSTSEPYEVNARLWSDGAIKQRWMNVPNGETITVTDTDDWDFPIGSVLVKNFSIEDQLLETRLFMRHDDGGWAGYTYEWNDQETEATLVPAEGSDRQVGSQIWHYPSRIECVQCHTGSIGFVAGPETAQLNRYFRDSSTGEISNQLTRLANRFNFENANFDDPTQLPMLADIEDDSQTDHWKSRSYLYSNCAMCHQPGGSGRGPEDFRYALTDEQINAINVDAEIDDLGIADAQLISPGDADNSVMALRMHSLDPTIRMPQIGTTLEDVSALSVIDGWIDSLDDAAPDSAAACGEPVIDPAENSGIYLWRDCSTSGTWHLSSVAGGDLGKFIGKVISDGSIAIESTSLTQTQDSVALNPAGTDLSFSLNQHSNRIDSFSFTVNPNSRSCLTFDFPVNTQIWLGSGPFKVTSNTLDLSTLGACDLDEVGFGPTGARGAPDIDRQTESGVFVWQDDSSDTWFVRVHGGGLPSALTVEGSITSNGEFLSITERSIEASDLFDTSDSNLIDFRLRVRSPWFDGFQFTVPNGADLCLMVNDPSVEIRVGPTKTLVSAPFDLSILSACQTGGGGPDPDPSTDPAIDGEPTIDPAVDQGVFVWRDNGVWHLKTTTFSNRFFVQGRVQSYNSPLVDADMVSLEENGGGDIFDVQGNNRFRFRMITRAGDQDEITFVVNDTGESCFNIKIPRPIQVYLGPNRTPIPYNFDLISLAPCSRGT